MEQIIDNHRSKREDRDEWQKNVLSDGMGWKEMKGK